MQRKAAPGVQANGKQIEAVPMPRQRTRFHYRNPYLAASINSYMKNKTLKLRLKYKNCRFILVSRRCPNIEAIELRRPKRGARTRPRRYFADSLVMIRVFLLVHKNISHLIIASA